MNTSLTVGCTYVYISLSLCLFACLYFSHSHSHSARAYIYIYMYGERGTHTLTCLVWSFSFPVPCRQWLCSTASEILVVHIMRSVCLAHRVKPLRYLVALAGGKLKEKMSCAYPQGPSTTILRLCVSKGVLTIFVARCSCFQYLSLLESRRYAVIRLLPRSRNFDNKLRVEMFINL